MSIAADRTVLLATTWDDPRVQALRDAMDAEIHPRYADIVRDIPPVAVDPADILVSLLALDGDEPVATASLKRTGPFAEVKRVFVSERGRRRGLAALLLSALEDEARQRGYRDLHLQTGCRQPEAMALYEREGWLPTAPFGPYAGDLAVSRCYAKPLVAPLLAARVHAGGAEVVAGLGALDEAGVAIALVDDDLVGERASIDATSAAAAAASRTRRIALAPRVRVTHAEPFHVSKAVQTLDWVSRGRAGWVVDVSTAPEDAAAFGRRAAPGRAEAWEEAGDVVAVSRALWDSWEDDAEIRDVATGRFVDKDRIHAVDFTGRWFSVKGPSIVPRSPQGQIPVVVEAAPADADAERFAAAHADVVVVRGEDAAARIARLRALAGERPITVLLEPGDAPTAPHGPADEASRRAAAVPTQRAETGADGVVLPADAAGHAARILLAPLSPAADEAPRTLREALGLPRPTSRYAAAETASKEASA